MNGLYFIYHNHVVGDFKFKVVSKFGEEMITDWYSEIKDIYYIKKQFKCEEEQECGAYSNVLSNKAEPPNLCTCKN